MRERELMRMQPLPRETEAGRQRGVGPVERITDARMPVRRHVHADLVSASGLEMDFEKRRAGERLERLVVGDRGLAVGVTANFQEWFGCRPIGASIVPASGSGCP